MLRCAPYNVGMKAVLKICLSASVALSATWVGTTLFASQGWPTRHRLATDLLRVCKDNDDTEERISVLRRDVEALGSRWQVQEQAVRDVLGWVKPGDLIIHLEEK